jgi:hypothetical protein
MALEVYAPPRTLPPVIHRGARGDDEGTHVACIKHGQSICEAPPPHVLRLSVRRVWLDSGGLLSAPGSRQCAVHPLAAGHGRVHLSSPRDRPAGAAGAGEDAVIGPAADQLPVGQEGLDRLLVERDHPLAGLGLGTLLDPPAGSPGSLIARAILSRPGPRTAPSSRGWSNRGRPSAARPARPSASR